MEARNRVGETPLEIAVAADAASVIHVLVANGVDLQIRDRSLRDRPLLSTRLEKTGPREAPVDEPRSNSR